MGYRPPSGALSSISAVLYRGSTVAITNGSTANITWTTIVRSVGGLVAAAGASSFDTITVPAGGDGLYLVTFQASRQTSAGPTTVWIDRNGAVAALDGRTVEKMHRVTAMVGLVAGDTVKLRHQGLSAGGTLGYDDGNFQVFPAMSLARIGT